MTISPQEYQGLISAGYSPEEIKEAVSEVGKDDAMGGISQEEVEKRYKNMVYSGKDPREISQPAFFSSSLQDNMIKWQLDLNELLERAEHILRGDKLKFIKGVQVWISPEDKKDEVLNDYGVQEVMRILSMYLNRNTILADYDQDVIDKKVYDFGKELSDLFFMKYEAFGLVNLEKRKNYPMLIREMVDIVHSAYQRALHGGERRSLREARQVVQSESLSSGNVFNVGQQQRERGPLNPARYVLGKYK